MSQNLDSPAQYYWEAVEILGVVEGLKVWGHWGDVVEGDCGVLASFSFFPSCSSHDVRNVLFCHVSQQNGLPNHGSKSTRSNDHILKPPKETFLLVLTFLLPPLIK